MRGGLSLKQLRRPKACREMKTSESLMATQGVPGHPGTLRQRPSLPQTHPCLSESPNPFRVQPYVPTANSSTQVRVRARWPRPLALAPCCPTWPKVTRLLEAPRRGAIVVAKRSRGPACLLPGAIGWCSRALGADAWGGGASRPPGRRAERGWHCVAGGGTAFVCCWRSLLRTVPCMWMRPRGATGSSPRSRPRGLLGKGREEPGGNQP